MNRTDMAFDYLQNYMKDKYDKYSEEILLSNEENSLFDLSFSTFLDEMRFALLYENEKYELVLEKARKLVYRKLLELEDAEVNILFVECIHTLSDKEFENVLESDKAEKYMLDPPISQKYQLIAGEFLIIISQKVVESISMHASTNLIQYIEDLKASIKNFAFDGSLEGDDVATRNYWEEFCFQVQYGGEDPLRIVQEGIETHIKEKLKKISYKDIVLLYTETDNYYGEVYDTTSPFPDRDEMVESIVSKVFDEISWEASNAYVPDFYNGEDWD
ncbi:hypothetical protein [Rossellomorea vietnamensis]|uniref:hypothetical protein n=1 Tax=Rossellomorea vietnamensis TaxID=218284 RepID=UPI00077CA719|nr:hypothetical protein [Rossellomorea vietnamensis]